MAGADPKLKLISDTHGERMTGGIADQMCIILYGAALRRSGAPWGGGQIHWFRWCARRSI